MENNAMINTHIPETHVDLAPQPGLGRLISFDPQDQNFLMSAAAPLEVTRSSAFWWTPKAFDQGDSFECTSYSVEMLLMADPVRNPLYLTFNKLYKLNQMNDEWPGESYQGSSVRAAMKVLQAAGLISEYVWAFDADTVRRWVLMKGPVVLGTNWYKGMNVPDRRTGFVRPTGRPVGGHAYCIRGADDNIKCPDGSKGALRIINSWGTSWGDKGRAWLSYKDADGLIKNHGEAVTPVEMFNVTPKIITGVIE
jgi:hypothetical protein